ncbi:hypothetical protein O181_071873 [Austropuccinia psidii MF-1]|uniref:Uncharacterized protein n=1 Tax=Austropuccinia psidii MF-1 TaxID=1389203 RepID=A0A9Q3F1V6_9BASI|nr:hypothetical protein [Austropuccinia psidii MF-1]
MLDSLSESLSQPQRMTLLHWSCGNSNLGPTWANWPRHIFMANSAPSGALWNFGHVTLPWTFMASGPILPSLASQANSHIPNPQASIFVFRPGGSGSPSPYHRLWANPFHYGIPGLNGFFGPFRRPTASMVCGPWAI